MRRFTFRAVARAAGVGALLALVGVPVLGAAPASASTTNGTATVAPASGGSQATFTVTLPANAACDGDTATYGYHVYSYLVPAGTTISTLTFPGEEPSTGYGLFTSGGTYYGPVNTAVTTGQIVSIPSNFEWAPLVTDAGLTVSQLAGTWETGLVCVNTSGAVTDSWVAQVTFVANGSDPTGFTWTSVAGPPVQSPEISLAVVLPFAGLMVMGGGLWVTRRRSGRKDTLAVTSRRT
jgi:hypothetical protein